MCQTSNTQVSWQYTLEYPDEKDGRLISRSFFFNTNFFIMQIYDFEKALDCWNYFVGANTDI